MSIVCQANDVQIQADDVQIDDAQPDPSETHLLPPDPELWGEMARALRNRLSPGRFRYALVGLGDDTMADIVPTGSLVEIDEEQTEVQPAPWRSLRERPLYLVRHGREFTCCWCQLQGDDLTLVPHPLSQRKAMHFSTPEDARVVGKVVRMWMPLELPTRSELVESYSSLASFLHQDSNSALAPISGWGRIIRSVA